MSIIFANRIPANIYGIYKYFISILGILSISTLTGIGPVVSQAVARGLEGSLFEGLKTKIKYGSIGGCASIGIGIYYLLNNNIQLAIIFFIASIFIPFMDSFHIYQDYLQGKKIFDKSSIYISSSQAIATLIMILTVIITDNIYMILLAYLFSWTGIRIFFFLLTIKNYPPNNSIDPKSIPLGKHMSFMDVIATLIGSLDSILIFHYLGSAELAIYSFAIAPITQLVGLFRNIPTLATPKLANRPVKEINQLLYKRLGIFFIFAFLIMIIYNFFSNEIYSIFFPKYLASIPISKIYSLTMLISIPLTLLSAAVGSKITFFSKKILYVWNIPGFLSTLFIFIFIQKLGIYAVAYARITLLIASASISIILWRYVTTKDRKNNKSNPDIYPDVPLQTDP
jgi:O-antigen/teichoic acid export membrane protein